jgi:hypothetical protein
METRPLTIVDFCCGSGHLGLSIAYTFSTKVRVILVEINPVATMKARERIRDLGHSSNSNRWNQIEVFTGNMEDFHQPFDIGVAIHACGPLTDFIHQKCLIQRASYVICPCCIGKIQHYSETSLLYHMNGPSSLSLMSKRADQKELVYPRSNHFADILLTQKTPLESGNRYHQLKQQLDDYFSLSKYGDYGEWQFDTTTAKERRICKSLIELDRNLAAEEKGYRTLLLKMKPENCTPKNDIIVGWYKGERVSI